MKLKYVKSVSESVVSVSLSLTNMTTREKKALRVLGSPMVTLDKEYSTSGVTVSLEQAVDSFGVDMEFPGEITTISEVLEEAQTFITDMQEAITDVMLELMTSYKAVESAISSQSGELEIRDGEQAGA